jgi:hypothetical protein
MEKTYSNLKFPDDYVLPFNQDKKNVPGKFFQNN